MCLLLAFVFTLSWLRDRPLNLAIPLLRTHDEAILNTNPDDAPRNHTSTLDLPVEYQHVPEHTEYCADRYQRNYLEHLRDSAVSYCTNNTSSQLHCFHSKTVPERTDTFCYGTNAAFNATQHKYRLPCAMRQLSEEEVDGGVPPVAEFIGYWYNTGPKNVFGHEVLLRDEQTPQVKSTGRRISVLVKREGGANLWHSLMEIFATSLTLDTLRSTVNPETGAAFLTEADRNNTQVVFLDDDEDGPADELWNMFFATRSTIRLKNITADNVGDIIVPLAGGGNPFWQGDWEARPCEDSELLQVFSARVLEFLHIQTPAREGNVRVTWVKRTGSRRLINEEQLVETAKARIPHIELQVVDFAEIPFRDQVQLVRNTDVLVGVHGAGLTHGMWLQPGSVIAEILPLTLNYKGFRNMAALLGLDYFSVHGTEPKQKSAPRAEWQSGDVELDEEKFVSLVESAVRSTYKKGMRDFDID
ncbi:hypothetical protein EJ05DRAFT_471884 [Pseudovirgaria hyperparasitica]|uniref:EGF domain-specific O-linked N-acetylglucosamine transferase n=1 Tax=Pseudovirgaria hyperparasitica TaxID=470096 RepID=A0A6A6WL73_9PEZI|nr:uncharacterized protein EJ05DRAFT_471884 [Pseudovirgaria hyperparasitica]KAF2762923.1 hypothetical protein EJ05DRAFT_471884 [Pseudovirgaria hyperparasitica]